MSFDLEELLLTLEIGSAGAVTTFAAWHLGLQRIEVLLAIFFTMTLLGQLTTAMLARVRGEL
jgi:hypothetical protein